MLNTIALVGILERDPHVRFDADSGQAKCRGTLRLEEANANGTVFKTYVPLEAFGKVAESLSEQHTGVLLTITGKLTWQRYTAKDGTDKSSLAVLVQRFTVLHGVPVTQEVA